LKPARYRPTLEALEDRNLRSTINVVTLPGASNIPAERIQTLDGDLFFTTGPGEIGRITPTGQVTPNFAVGGHDLTVGADGNLYTALGNTLSAGGKASFTTSFSTAGSHAIQAVFSGSSNFTGSSQTVAEQVSAATAPKATTTALVTSANRVRTGQAVTFTAAVSGPAGAGTPTGTVTFFVNNTAVATVTLSATGKASLTGSFSAAGTYTIRAVYSGDSNFAASSQSLTEQVL
jgi:hypothetical protein